MSTKTIIRQAYVELTADLLDAYGKMLSAKAQGAGIGGLQEFSELYNAKVAKLRKKGKLGPKAWTKLRETMPAQAVPYFRGLVADGYDMTTDQGLGAFTADVIAQTRDIPQNDRAAIFGKFAQVGLAVFEDEDGDEEGDDEDL